MFAPCRCVLCSTQFDPKMEGKREMTTTRQFEFKKPTVILMLLAIVGASVLAPRLGSADDQEINAKELPSKIRQALRGVEIHEVEKEVKDGATFYEITIVVRDVEVEFLLDTDGHLLSLEVDDEDEDVDTDDEDEDETDDEEDDDKEDDE